MRWHELYWDASQDATTISLLQPDNANVALPVLRQRLPPSLFSLFPPCRCSRDLGLEVHVPRTHIHSTKSVTIGLHVSLHLSASAYFGASCCFAATYRLVHVLHRLARNSKLTTSITYTRGQQCARPCVERDNPEQLPQRKTRTLEYTQVRRVHSASARESATTIVELAFLAERMRCRPRQFPCTPWLRATRRDRDVTVGHARKMQQQICSN